MLTLQLCTLLLLLVIFIEDMCGRSVHWFLFPLLALTLIILHGQQTPVQGLMRDVTINGIFVLLQFALVTAYFGLRKGQWITLTQGGLLGWGDILFVLSLTFYFSPGSFIAFYSGSLLAVLIGWLGYQLLFSGASRQIPLAGLQALLLAFTLSFGWISHRFDLTQDTWLISYLSLWTA